MKKLALLFTMMFCMAASAQTDDDGWEKWEQASCYSKILYRLRYEGLNGEQHHWKVQFRNGFGSVVSFNYHLAGKLEENSPTTHRKVLQENKDSEAIDIYTKEEDIYLLVDKVSLSPYPQNFLECETGTGK